MYNRNGESLMTLSIKKTYSMTFSVKNLIAILFIVAPSIKPYVIRISAFDNIYDAWGVLTFLVLLFNCVILRRISLNKTVKYLFLFVAVYFISTIIYGYASLLSVISEVSRMMICPLYLSMCNKEGYFKLNRGIANISKLYKIVLYIDCISILVNLKIHIFQSEIFSFLGMDNTAAFIIVPMLTVIIYNDVNRNNKISANSLFLLVLCTLCKLLTFSVTAILSLFVFVILLCISNLKELRQKIKEYIFKPKKYLIIIIFVVIGIVFLNIQYLFADIILALGKDVDLGRVRIWKNVIATFWKSPIIGYGKVEDSIFIDLVGMTQWDTTCNHPHNSVLAIIFNCGLVGAFFYFKMMQIPLKNIVQNISSSKYRIISIGLISFFVLMLADDYMFMPYIYVLFCVGSFNKYNGMVKKHYGIWSSNS